MKAVKEKGNKAAMILDRIVLCNQTSKRLEKYGIDHGVLQSGHWRYRPYENIQVCSAQTLEKRGKKVDSPRKMSRHRFPKGDSPSQVRSTLVGVSRLPRVACDASYS